MAMELFDQLKAEHGLGGKERLLLELAGILQILGLIDLNGATVTIEVSPGGIAPWFDSGVVITAAQAINIEFKARKIRAVVSGGGGTVSISADMV